VQKGEKMTPLEMFFIGFWFGCFFMWGVFAYLIFRRFGKELKTMLADIETIGRKP